MLFSEDINKSSLFVPIRNSLQAFFQSTGRCSSCCRVRKKHQLFCSAVSPVIDSNAKCGKICPWVHIIHCPGGRGQAEALMPSEEELASQKESALGCDPQLSHWVPISWLLLPRFYRAIALQWERQKAKTTKTRSLSV